MTQPYSPKWGRRKDAETAYWKAKYFWILQRDYPLIYSWKNIFITTKPRDIILISEWQCFVIMGYCKNSSCLVKTKDANVFHYKLYILVPYKQLVNYPFKYCSSLSFSFLLSAMLDKNILTRVSFVCFLFINIFPVRFFPMTNHGDAA